MRKLLLLVLILPCGCARHRVPATPPVVAMMPVMEQEAAPAPPPVGAEPPVAKVGPRQAAIQPPTAPVIAAAPAPPPRPEPPRHHVVLHAVEAQPAPDKGAASQGAAKSNQGSSNGSGAPNLAGTVHTWYENLPVGAIRYVVPNQMTLNQTYTASATIHPPTAAGSMQDGGSSPGQSRVTKQLKVATFMRVVLDQEKNPGAFKIDPEHGDCKFVSVDTDTEWDFQITPLQGGKHKTLTFTTYVVYGNDASVCTTDGAPSMQLVSDQEDVSVAEFSIPVEKQHAEDTFWTDPVKWIKYILPGGAVFTAISTLIAWWRKRRGKPAPAPEKPEGGADSKGE